MQASTDLVARAAAGDAAVYGVNTGFGKLASIKIAPADTEALQRDLVQTSDRAMASSHGQSAMASERVSLAEPFRWAEYGAMNLQLNHEHENCVH